MEYLRIGKLDESDFDEVFAKIGGRRFSADHSREERKNADFVLGNAVVELKLINEEGLEKEERRRKIADIFRAQYPGRPVIVLHPGLLDEIGRRQYYNAMMGPIKTHVEKANKQLKRSAEDLGGDPVRVLLLINNGYGALSHEEFREIAVRRACNATHSIDAVVAAGLYFYSDTFDSYFFPMMDLFPIHVDRPFTAYDSLLTEWQRFAEDHLTRCCIFGEETRKDQRLPVQELTFVVDNVTFIKPAPPMGKESPFFVNGRPRQNSSGITTCPTIARTFPEFDAPTWQQFKGHLPLEGFFKKSYADWLRFRDDQYKAMEAPTGPVVPVRVHFDACIAWCKEQERPPDAQAVADYANALFDSSARRLIDSARNRTDVSVIAPRYVLLITEVIGQDMANDLSSIYSVNDDIAGERRRPLVENERIFFEHGLALAAAYALKYGFQMVMYGKDETNAWI